jgi:hypothetical protein
LTFSISIEERALRQTDCVSRLRFLRGAETRRRGRRDFAARAGRIGLTAMALCFANQLGRSKASAPVQPAISREARATTGAATADEAVWLVEESVSRGLYSNGLIVRREHEVNAAPRRYHAYERQTLRRGEQALSVPAGIVFHTTESQILPLEPGRTGALLRSRQDVLDHAHNGKCYNFVIDRFGQVFRLVPEEQTALHAGHSVWASGDTVWIDLNESFLGVSFEAETAKAFAPSAAQMHSGRLLTEMLRARYKIPVENCVTHAQVSVNPDNARIGYHTDWGSSFPFLQLGLPDNYALPVAAVTVFGFLHDDAFRHAVEDRLWSGLIAADRQVSRLANEQGLTAHEFSIRLQQRYTTLRRQRHG